MSQKMEGIDKRRPGFEDFLFEFQKSRDVVFGGERAVKHGERRKKYLPMLSGQKEADYLAYQTYGGFYEAAKRTLSAYTGMAFRNPPTVKLSSALESYLDGCDGGTCGIIEFNKMTFQERAAIGWFGVMLDYPPGGTLGPPWMSKYNAESILDCEHGIYYKGGIAQVGVTYARLLETSKVRGEGEKRFEFTDKKVVRELLIENGVYLQRVWTESDKKGEWDFEDIPVTKKGGDPLDFIPFTLSAQAPTVSPMMPLINANLQHFAKEVDHGYGLHFTALPQPWGSGVLNDEIPKSRSPMEFWQFSNPEATIGMLTLAGGDMDALGEKITKIEDRMAILGARILENSRTGIEAAETARIRQTGEISSLTDIVDDDEEMMLKVLDMAQRMTGEEGENEYVMNRDFIDTKLTPEQLVAYMQAHQGGTFPPRALYEAQKTGEVLPKDMEFDEWDQERKSAFELGE